MLLLVAALSLTAAAQPAKDDAAIRGLVKNYLEFRDRADTNALAAIFVADVDQLVSSGEWRRGRGELVKGTIASTGKGGKRTLTVETIRYITSDTAIADARYELVGAADTRRMWSTFVFVRQSGNWKIAAIRNMLPAAPAQ
jgi:uncharacterized protein (TIGR02246 family)